MVHVWSTVRVLVNILFFILLVTMPSLVWGQDPGILEFMLRSTIYQNNSMVAISDIGEGENALLCTTELQNCCSRPNGTFYYPNNTEVMFSFTNSLYRNRGPQVVRLNRRDNAHSPVGVYKCEIPDSNGVNKSLYINITAITCPDPLLSNVEDGTITYSTMERVLGTTATVQCNEGFVVGGGAHVRSCVRSGSGFTGHWDGDMQMCSAITCSALPDVTNGMIVYSSDTTEPFDFGTTASYQCDDGYEIGGDDVMRTCDGDGSSPDGQWSGTTSVCSAICPDLPPLTNGVITYSLTSTPRLEGNMATQRCNNGYTQSGGTMRTCQSDRTWSGGIVTCQPVSCGPPPSISNGSPMTTTSTTFGGTATYSCNIGYEKSGSATVTCQASGSWSTRPTCTAYCSKLPSISNGDVTYHPTNRLEGARARYTCSNNYQISEDNTRTCVDSGSGGVWSESVPTCTATCGDSRPLTNGNITYSPTNTPRLEGATSVYSCRTGYQISDERMLTCRDPDNMNGGSWVGTIPTCTAICADLPTLVNGIIIYNPSSSPRLNDARAIYSCHNGYHLSGNSSRVCEDRGDGGVWSGTTPTCRAIKCPALTDHGINGAITYSTELNTGSNLESLFSFGTQATYLINCTKGLERTGGDDVRTCDGDGSSPTGHWSGTAPVCSAISVYLSLGETRYYTNSSQLVVTQIGTTDDNTLNCHTDQTTCCRGSDNPDGGYMGFGEWVFPNGRNVPKNSDDITNGFVRDRGAQVVRLRHKGNVVDPLGTYCCKIPDRNGMTRTFCANIVAISCPPLMAINNEHITRQYSNRLEDDRYIFGTVATYSCSSGFGLSSTQGRMCVGGTEGMFDGSDPTCEPICPDLPPLTNGDITYSPTSTPRLEGATARHSCDNGYELSGGTMRTCQSDRTWSGRDITCQSVSCGSPPSISNGSPGTPTSTMFEGTVTYSCDNGYEQSGSATVTCQASGSWSTRPSCTVEMINPTTPHQLTTQATSSVPPGVTCSDLTVLINGRVSYNSGSANDRPVDSIVTYSCEEGYILDGENNRVCQSDGSWSGVEPTCQAVSCGSPPSISNGSPGIPTRTTFEGTVTYSCDTGLILVGSSTITCLSTSSWSTPPICQNPSDTNTFFPAPPPVYISHSSTNYVTSISEILLSTVGEGPDEYITCHTDLPNCCRAFESGVPGGFGEWYYPNGTIVQPTPSEDFYRSKDSPMRVNLNRRRSATGPVGLYCCVIPTSVNTQTFCVSVVEMLSPTEAPSERTNFITTTTQQQGSSSQTDNTGSVIGGIVGFLLGLVVITIGAVLMMYLVLKYRSTKGVESRAPEIPLNAVNTVPTYETVDTTAYEEIAPRTVKMDFECSQNEAYLTTTTGPVRGGGVAGAEGSEEQS